MIQKRVIKGVSFMKLCKIILFISVLILIPIFTNIKIPMNNVRAHSDYAWPTEIFSLWNDSTPILDGHIQFSAHDISTEWSGATFNQLFNSEHDFCGVLLLQNDNDSLYIAMDMFLQQEESPSSPWGCAVYFDSNHDGLLTSFISDRSLLILTDSSGTTVYWRGYDVQSEEWDTEEQGSIGTFLPSGIYADMAFDESFYNDANHHQYELKIPLNEINSNSGDIMGIAFESFEDFNSMNDAVTWPYIDSTTSDIRYKSGIWGDIYLGEGGSADNNIFSEYVIEKNMRIKYDAVGPNNGTFFTTGDIDGNGDLELIINSNRTAATSEGIQPLIAIFDNDGGTFQRIWSSWQSSLPQVPFFVKQLATHDFDKDGQEEIYACGFNKQILRISGWDNTTKDFSNMGSIYNYNKMLMGYISIGDVDNDGEDEIICGDQDGEILILRYRVLYNDFAEDQDSPLKPPNIGDNGPYRIHALEIENMDQDDNNELLIQSQSTDDDALSVTYLQILEKPDVITGFIDNVDDDLPSDSSSTTQDYHGHSIIVNDVDNDLMNETIIAGKNYLRIFEQNGFTDPTMIREFSINSNEDFPYMGGTATVGDLDSDGSNELIFGCNNGTLLIYDVSASGYNDYDFIWKGDVGSSLGKREALVVKDTDLDNENEIIVGDNFGQILLLGKSEPPSITITSPTTGSKVGKSPILVEWDIEDDSFSMHHYDIKVNNEFVGRGGGGQSGYLTNIILGLNTIEVICFDITGKTSSDSIQVELEPGTPEIEIYSPENNYGTNKNNVLIEYNASAPNGIIDHYEIWRNDSLINDQVTEDYYDLSLPEEGIWNVTVVAVNTIGKKGRDMIYIILDLEKPSVSITYPSNGKALKNTEIQLEWIASDSLTGIDYFNIYKNTEFYASTSETSYFISLNIDNEYLLSVEAFDNVGNSAIDEITIVRDTKKPNISIVSPENDYITNDSTLSLSWNVTDNAGGSGIDFSEVKVNDVIVYNGPLDNVSIDIGEEEGTKNIDVTTYDKAGNSATDYVSVVLDTSDPILNITSPVDNFTTGLSHVMISWESQDAGTGVKEYQVFINDTPKTVISDPEETYYQAYLPDNQTYKITIRCLDYLDNIAEDSVYITYDPSTPTLSIINPEKITLYSNKQLINISWQTLNIDNIQKYDIYIDNELNKTIEDINQTTILMNFDLAITTNPMNLTISAVKEGGQIYTDFRWIIIDQILPEITIISPEEDKLVLDQNLAVEWIGDDVGSGIKEYQILLNNELVKIISADKTSTLIVLEENYNHKANLSLRAIDKAGNNNTDLVSLNIYLYPPRFTTGLLTDSFTTNTGEFQFNLTITDPGLGVKKIDVFADMTHVLGLNYEENIKTNPFWVLVNITEFTNVSASSWHNITVSVTDINNREGISSIPIYVDHTSPTFINTIFDNNVLSMTDTTKIVITDDGINHHNISVYVTDDSSIQNVSLTILSNELNQTYNMQFSEKLGVDFENATYVYSLCLDLEGFELGEYTLVFTITDIGNNSYTGYYDITLSKGEQLPWIMRGNNIIYVSIGGSLLFVLIIVLVIGLRKPIANIGWREAVLAVAYVTKTGTTCIYLPYSSELIADDQLFGGAMTGIRGVLQEITGGHEVERKVENVEVGNKQFLIYPGEFGEGVLLTNSPKPILKTNLIKFTEDFEEEFRRELKEDIINLDEFALGKVMIEGYFGIAPTNAQECLFEPLDESLTTADDQSSRIISSSYSPADNDYSVSDEELPLRSEITSEEKQTQRAFPTLSPENEALLFEIINATGEAIIALTDGEYDTADGKAQTVVNGLEIILQSNESLDEIQDLIEELPAIIEEVFKGIQYGRAGETEELIKSIEKASEIFEELS